MLTEIDYAGQAIELMRALQQGRKIEAIKAFRVLTGHGLKESKDQVEFTVDGVIRNYRQPDEAGSFVVIDHDNINVIHDNYRDASQQAGRLVTGETRMLIAKVHSQVRADIVVEPYSQ